MEKYERITGEVQVFVFPDNGPQQHDISVLIRENGGKAHLYDGVVENNIKTSTNANWRWKFISIDGADKWANVGDYIVKDGDGLFRVFTPDEFVKLFKQKDA